MQILTNHLGYSANDPKHAIVQANKKFTKLPSAILDSAQPQIELNCGECIQVPGWKDRWFSVIDFSHVYQPGSYMIRLGEVESHPFSIHENNHQTLGMVSDLLHYFKSQRCGGIYDRHDRTCPVHGDDRKIDVHGGWYDASGDVSKYLSHLSYTNYMNPQQTPQVVWNILYAHDLLNQSKYPNEYSLQRMTEEALHGADFLVRMQDPDGFFHMIVFDVWSKDVSKREICSYSTQEGHKHKTCQAGFRQGGGMAVAALAAASRHENGNAFSAERYLQAAVKGYWHLRKYNLRYLDDGVENIIDAYCALMASVELYKATGQVDSKYLEEARHWAETLMQYRGICTEFGEIWFADKSHTRAWFHAVEAGLPCIALMQYIGVEGDSQRVSNTRSVVAGAVSAELELAETANNLFRYPQQVVQDLSGNRRLSFFIPHENESGYWWQGENARLASLAAMAGLARLTFIEDGIIPRDKLNRYATHSIDWILGLNPFDACMLDGYGWNNPTYWPEAGYHNAKGGICNGITSGFEDEDDIALKPMPQDTDPLENWRWGEQWIPHAAWFLLAVVYKSIQPED